MRVIDSKKIHLILILMIVLIFSCDEINSSDKNLVSLIPQNTDIVIRINDINALKNKIKNDDLLKNLYFSKDITLDVKNLINDSLNSQVIAFSNFGKNEKAITVFHKTTKDSSNTFL